MKEHSDQLNGTLVARLIFVLVLLHPLCASGQLEQRIEAKRAEFLELKRSWLENLQSRPGASSSFVKALVACHEFYALLDLGPAVIPFFFESKDMGVCGGVAIQVLTRADIVDLIGMTQQEAARVNMYPVEEAWWKKRAIPESGPETEKRLAAFRATIPPASMANSAGLEASLKEPEGYKLSCAGVFGIPTIINKLKRGETDLVYYRLLAYWTNPYELIDGVPSPPQSVEVTPEQSDPKHWLDWWEENAWQYKWLTEPAK